MFEQYFKKVIFILVIIFQCNCVHNYEPVIKELIATPNPVQSGGIVYLNCIASDDDQGNMVKTDSLTYYWEASFGIIGEIIVNDTTIDTSINNANDTIYDTIITVIDTLKSDSIRQWNAPQDSGMYSISCTVSDLFNGLDIVTINISVE